MIGTGPGGASYGYLTPAVVMQKGGSASYTNGDVSRHDVVSSEGLFRSGLASTGQTVPVTGVGDLTVGQYEFFCSHHPNMKGQLIVR